MIRILSFLLFYFSTQNVAYAYLDSGLTTMLFQLIAGGAVGLIVILRLYWQRLKSFFSRGTKDDEIEDENIDSDSENSDP